MAPRPAETTGGMCGAERGPSSTGIVSFSRMARARLPPLDLCFFVLFSRGGKTKTKRVNDTGRRGEKVLVGDKNSARVLLHRPLIFDKTSYLVFSNRSFPPENATRPSTCL